MKPSLKLPQKKGRKEEAGRVRGNEDGGVSVVVEEAVIVFFLLTQTVSSYVLLPSLLIFIPELLREEYKAGSAGSDDFGQISLLLLLTGSKYPSSHSGLGLNRLLHHLPVCPSSLLDALTSRLKVDLSNCNERLSITLRIEASNMSALPWGLGYNLDSPLCSQSTFKPPSHLLSVVQSVALSPCQSQSLKSLIYSGISADPVFIQSLQ